MATILLKKRYRDENPENPENPTPVQTNQDER